MVKKKVLNFTMVCCAPKAMVPKWIYSISVILKFHGGLLGIKMSKRMFWGGSMTKRLRNYSVAVYSKLIAG